MKSDDLKETDILFIDNLKGPCYRIISPLLNEIKSKKNGLTAKMLHLESINKRDHVPENERRNNLDIYDISYFDKSLDIRSIISNFSPKIIMTFNQTRLFDRALINVANDLEIKIIYLQHGKISFRENKSPNQFKIKSLKNKARRYFWYFLPSYFYSMLKVRPNRLLEPDLYKFIVGSLFRNYAFVPPKPTSEVRADLALVYGSFYKERIVELHGYEDENVKVVGNLDLDELVDIQEENSSEWNNISKNGVFTNSRKTLTYLTQPIVQGGHLEKIEYKNWVKNLCDRSEDIGFNLILKLHPRENASLYKDVIENYDNVFLFNESLFKVVFLSDFILSHYTTAIDLAVALFKPIIIFDITDDRDKIESLYFHDIAPVASVQSEVFSLLEDLSSEEFDVNRESYKSWLDKFSYFDPEEKAVKRVANIILEELN